MANTEQDEISRLRRQLSQMSDLLDAEKIAQRIPKNMDFIQVSRAELRAIAELGAKSSLALDLLMVLAQSMNKQNAVMFSFKAMEQVLGKSRPTLDRAVRLLREDQWIQVIKVGSSNAYVLNSAVFWTDRGDKRHYASFGAQIVTTLDEQDRDLRDNPKVQLKRVPIIAAKEERMTLGTDELPPPDQKDLDLS